MTDTGPGIPPGIATSALERHVSSDRGHGLGLSIVSALCERLGWELRLEAGEGPGTSVRLSF